MSEYGLKRLNIFDLLHNGCKGSQPQFHLPICVKIKATETGCIIPRGGQFAGGLGSINSADSRGRSENSLTRSTATSGIL